MGLQDLFITLVSEYHLILVDGSQPEATPGCQTAGRRRVGAVQKVSAHRASVEVLVKHLELDRKKFGS